MNMIGWVGSRWIESLRRLRDAAGLSAELISYAVQRARWPRTTRTVLARQIVFTGLDALPSVLAVAVVVGLAVVLQTKVWLARFGQSALVGPVLVAVVLRELGPLLVNFIVIGRSGTAMATEIAAMRVTGELEVIESQGLNVLAYLVLPRAVAAAISVTVLTIFFSLAAFVFGVIGGRLLGAAVGPGDIFLDSVLSAISRADVVSLLIKSGLPGWCTAIECSLAGLSAPPMLTSIPQAVTRGVMRSIGVLFLISLTVSVLIYI